LSQYFYTFSHVEYASLLSCYAFCGLAIHTVSSFALLPLSTSMFGHSHFWCPTLQHLKHCISSSPLFYCLISTLPLTPYCITWLTNTSNLFLGIGFPFSSLTLFLQLQARCLNFLQLKHFFLSLSSSSALNLARACYWLSMLLIKELYCLRDMVLCPSMLNKIDLTSYYYIYWGTRSLSN